MASNDENLYPIPIYYTDDSDNDIANPPVREKHDRGGKTRRRGGDHRSSRRGGGQRSRVGRTTNRGNSDISSADARQDKYIAHALRARSASLNRDEFQTHGAGHEANRYIRNQRTRGRGRGARNVQQSEMLPNREQSEVQDRSLLLDAERHQIRGRNRRRGKGSGRGVPVAMKLLSQNEESMADGAEYRDSARHLHGRQGRARGGMRGAHLKTYRSETALNQLDAAKLQMPIQYDEKGSSKGKNAPTGNREKNTDSAKARYITERLDVNESQPREFTLGYKKLEEWSKMTEDPDNLVLTIGHSRSGLVECLEKSLKPDWLHRILEILSIAVKTQTCTFHLRELLITIEDSLFQKVNDFLSQILIESETHRQFIKDKDKLESVCLLVTSVMKYHMDVLPSSLGKCYPVILLLKQVQNQHDLHNEKVTPEIQELEMKKESIKEERESLRQRITNPSKYQRKDDVDSEPPESFRELSILPSNEDLMKDRPFLRPNIEAGKYKDLDQYLDIQFRLLREDYIRPLREGINNYKTGLTSGLAVRKVRDIRLYQSVQIMMPVCTLSGICYVLQFDIEPFRRMNWNASKRLLYGSLVCLSADDFDTVIFGTVTDRNSKDIANGQIQVLFEHNDEVEIKPNTIYLMAETTAYFEAYRHILEGLHNMKESMPLQRYIIHCETDIKPPNYLETQGKTIYDFSCIMSDSAVKRGQTEYPVLDTDKWPRKEDLSFDTSQMDAIKMALAKELVLIQGPPGTGKTYVGLKIAKVLLANKTHWVGEGKTCPILIVCYTNHALDQFLEGIYTFCKAEIVRVGGRSNNATLEPFLLKNIRKKNRREKKRSIGLFKGQKDSIQRLQANKRQIERVSDKIKACSTKLAPILTQEYVPKVVSHAHSDSLRRRISYKFKEKALNIWLGLTSEAEEEENEILERLPPAQQIQRVWRKMLLNDIKPMEKEESDMVTDIRELPLLSRARLYKAWVNECVKNLEYALANVSRDKVSTMKTKAQIKKITSNIVEIETFKRHGLCTTFITQMECLYEIPLISPAAGHIGIWLCLDSSDRSNALIRDAIENPPVETEVLDDEDLEEARQLDDDDEDFLADYVSQDVEHSRNKILQSESEWSTVVSERKVEKKIRHMLNKAPKISAEEVARIEDVWKLSAEKRKELYRYWVIKYRALLKEEIVAYEKDYDNAVKQYKEIVDLESLEILRSASVIGMTTTGAAKNRTLLQKVKPKILIVEEAAEVLESHIITTLNKNCQHLILIGDHKQLRPNPTVYDLAKTFKLDISLFERMIKNEVPCVTLSEQHRMRPEISVLMRHKNLYPNLRDHTSVTLYDSIKGVERSVCFIDHTEPEEQTGESTSYYNFHEAQFVSAFCKYLLQQGYKAEQITVLSPYMGQVLTLRKEMPKNDFSGIRITAVDNFQGEENDIILLSLVRSSHEDCTFLKRNPIGFLGIENRVCVALSRAKKGLFVIGNFTHLAKHSEIWHFMVEAMKSKNSVKKYVTLRCQNHPESVIEAAKPEDFKKAPEGGCKLNCDYPLKCNHMCRRFCHIIDKTHEFYKCFKPCAKTNSCGHKCQKKCFQECLPCLAVVDKRIPMCGHIASIPCDINPVKWNCAFDCNAKLLCGHECGLKCGDCNLNKQHRKRCERKTKKKWPCGHVVKTECWKNPKDVPCPEPCTTKLSCRHVCSGTCGECLEGRLHRSCRKTCNKILPCGHTCSFPCSEICPPCSRACDWVCSHGLKCKNKCSEECHRCAEDCAVKCRHKKCTNECFKECENFKCDEPCGKLLKCKHPCAGLCGEVCPEFCPVCDPDRFSDPGERVIFLTDCKHAISVLRMDRHIEGLLQAERLRAPLVFRCPDCNRPVTKVIKRYVNFMKKRRQLIVKRYLTLTGTGTERKREATRLQQQIQKLKTLGLSPSDGNQLTKDIDVTDFGSLHNTRRKIEVLEELLKLRTEAEKAANKENLKIVSEQANKIKQILMMKRKYVTSQFWNEAKTEIRSLKSAVFRTEDECPKLNRETKQQLVKRDLSSHTLETTNYESLDVESARLDSKEGDDRGEARCLSVNIGTSVANAREIYTASDEVVVVSDEINS